MQKEVISKSPRIIRAEFKVAEKDGQVGFYDTLTPLYASFHEDDQAFSLMWTEYDESFPVFYQSYLDGRAGPSGGSSTGKRLYRILCPMDLFPSLCRPLLRKQALLLSIGRGGQVLPAAGPNSHAPVHHLPPCGHRRISREVLPGHSAAGCRPVPRVSVLKKAGVTAGPIPSFHDEALESSNDAIFHQKTASSKIIQSFLGITLIV